MRKLNLAKLFMFAVILSVPAMAGSFTVSDFLCGVYHTIGEKTTGYSLITVGLLIATIGVGIYAAVTSFKEKKANTLFIVIAIVLLVLTTTWGSLVDTISTTIGFDPFIKSAPTNCNANS